MSKKEKKGRKRYESSSDSESIDSEEEARRKDLQERDEFASRLKKRDETKTRNIVQASDRRAYEEAAKRLKMENEDREKMIPMLRVHSRRKYLEKRKEDKIAELEEDIADDEYLFEDEMFVLTIILIID
jgi:pre-mRNA-splicing factor ATP-dependent RNA helicase DHX16